MDAWGVVGISLGGHSTWLALTHGKIQAMIYLFVADLWIYSYVDPRVTVGVPIIGCPDYKKLMEYRAKATGIPFEAPYIPANLVRLIEKLDPASKNHTSTEESNPFLGKKILVLSGEKDTLVPWVASKGFVDDLEVGPNGVKEVLLEEGVGHECTEKMKEMAGEFIRKSMLL